MQSGHLNPPLTRRLPGLAVAGIASLGAGAVHAAAAGVHAEHPRLAQLFILMAAAQLAAGMWALLRPHRLAAWAVAGVNLVAVAGWLTTRLTGISWIVGLEVREAPQFADTACALMGAVAIGTAVSASLVGWRPSNPARIAMPSLLIAALAVPAMWTGGTHVHSHGETDHAHAVDPVTGDTIAHDDHAVDPVTGDTIAHDDHAVDAVTGDTIAHDHAVDPVAAAGWPRPWDPAVGIDLSGVPGVSAEQQLRADKLINDTLRDLPKWSTTAAAEADGYTSIGDAGTGVEHYVKNSLIEDDVMLDPTQPESLVYEVDGANRTLTGAMFIASARPTDDPEIVAFAGPLMQWHNHGNLCWALIDGVAKVVGITDANGVCANGVNTGGANPMVHVWIAPNQCGPFAALEGVGAGQTAVSEADRVDKCGDHSGHAAAAATATPKPYDPTQPIDLSGTPGVTPEQQAAAENLIAITVVRLPKWSDYRVAEAAGFTSIGDARTGFEHFVNWDWINDDTVLDPDFPESLVYVPQPDGSKKLVSAMFMLPDSVALADVPNIGGALMQWHIHDNLCFTNDPKAARVGGLTSPDGTCPPGLVKFLPSAMIHVWITTNPCGPFAALEGVGAGQIAAGEQRLCDSAHGSH